jgi:hypothetical protein
VEQYIGVDVSLKDTSISVRQNGKHIWRGKCASDPKLLAEVIRRRAPHAERVVFETGPLSVWFGYVARAHWHLIALAKFPNQWGTEDNDGHWSLGNYFVDLQRNSDGWRFTRIAAAKCRR